MKIFSKNCTLLALLVMEKAIITIPNVSKIDLSIFYIPVLVFQIARSSFFTKAGCMTLTLLFKLIKTSI